MIQNILDSFKLWQWWVCQGFALAGLVFVVLSMQQKDVKKLLWYRLTAVALIVVGLCFTAVFTGISPIVLGVAGLVQVLIAMLFVYKPSTKPAVKFAAGAALGVLVIGLSILFRILDGVPELYLVIIAIAYGMVGLVAFFQKKPALTRMIVIGACVIGITYYLLLGLLINALMDGIALVSAVIGIIRLDLKKTQPQQKIEKEKASV